ncbi:Serine/threonine-protein kinase PknB [Planctomycetes bacterium CA13]|uniref:Serine/threonine-protein kinase PknB n=1 Tax=Novipirellula herctigrandis TaxID=2527986 RepID=A0A5C5Z4G9_9BACT|nr:Serine/threonine-protein kinase PknB [Planctomycetes bacterium CA13]
MDTHFDRLVDEFENELKSADSPQIERYVSQFPEESKELVLLELISLEVYYRVKNGQSVSVSDYARFGPTGVTQAEKVLLENQPSTSGQTSDFSATVVDGQVSEIAGEDIAALTPTKMIGQYQLLRKIGEGGMGTIWMAKQETPVKRRVAIKLIKPELVSADVIARFDAEKQALAMMDHQNIARVLDAGTSDTGSPYFVMELVNGIPITEYCDENKLSVDERLKLFVRVCEAVQHAHQKGIIHRDIKPSNVLVTVKNGEAIPKVIDFGLAKAHEHDLKLTDKTMLTEFGKIVGTIQYMSPEQAQLKRVDVDTRTDVYSLGVMLYELLTGSTPLDKETIGHHALLQVLEIIREKDPPRPSNRLSSSSHKATSEVGDDRRISPARLQQILKGDLDWVVMKALEKDRTRRYVTANDFAEDISSYMTGEAIKARPPSSWYQIRKFATRNRGLVASILAVGVVLLAGIAGTGYGLIRANKKTAEAEAHQKIAEEHSREADQERRKARESEQLALKEKNKAEKNEQRAVGAESLAAAESKRARDSEAAAKFQLANARWEANRALEARNLLHQIPPEYRDNFEWHFCRRHFQGSDITCYGHKDWVYKVAFSPNGKHVASAGRDSTIKIWDAETGQEIVTLTGHTNQVGGVAFSPDGSRLASASFDNTIKLWDTRTYREINTLTGHTKLVACVAFSPNGKLLASASDDATIKLWDVSSGRDINTLTGHRGEIGCVAFNANGTRLASASVDKTIKIWDAQTGEETTTLTGHAAIVISVAFSPDGAHLASASQDTIKLWDARSYREISTLRGHTQFVHNIAFSPDGTRLASAGRDKTIRLWDVWSGQAIATLGGHADWVNGISFSPDGSRLASASFDKTIKLWDARSGQETASLISLRGHAGTIYDVAISLDGTRMASAGEDKTIKLWDSQSGKEITTLTGHAATVSNVAFSPTGTHLASACTDGTVKLWETQSSREILTLTGHKERVNSLAFNPDGKLLATAANDKTIKVWDAKTGNEITTLKGHADTVNSISFSPDGRTLASAGSDGAIKLWDTRTLKEITTLKGRTRWMTRVTFSPDGSRLAAAAKNAVLLWDAVTYQQIMAFTGHTEVVTSIAFAPDGKRLATASHDKTIKLWDAKSGHEMTTLDLQTDRVYSIAFNPNGTRLVSAGTDGTIKLWDARQNQEMTPLRGHSDTVARVAFSPDGTRIYSQSVDGDQLVWNVETTKLVEAAEWDPPQEVNLVSPNRRWRVSSEMNNVMLVDLEYKNTPQEKAYRATKARFDPGWHREQAKQAVATENWYAATFHFALLIKNDPDQVQFHEDLHSSYQKLVARFEESNGNEEHDLKSYLAPVVREALELPRGDK